MQDFTEEALRPDFLLNFFSSHPAGDISVLLAHLQQAIRDIPAAWTRDLEAVASYLREISILAARVLVAQALVMVERADLEREMELHRTAAAQAQEQEQAEATKKALGRPRPGR